VIYSPHGRDLLTLFEHRFEAAHPDVDVRWLDMGSQEVYDRIRSERANPQADVWFGGPSLIFALAARDSLLDCHRPKLGRGDRAARRGPGDCYFATYETPASSCIRVVAHARPGPRRTGTICSIHGGRGSSSSAIRSRAGRCARCGATS